MSLAEATFREIHAATMAAFEGRIPGPPPSFPLGNAGAFVGANPWEPCLRWIAEYGDRVLLWMGGSPALLLNDPELLGELLETSGPAFHKDAPRPQLLPIVTDTSPFIANGEDWAEKREGHPFASRELGPWLASRTACLRASLRTSLDALVAKGHEVDFRAAMERTTFDGFAVMAVGEPLDDAAYEDFRTVSDQAQRRLASPIELPDVDPFFHRARERWFGRFDRYLAVARSKPGDDLVGRFLRTTTYTDEAFRNELANIFPAGVYSTTSTVMHTLALLARHPAAHAKVMAAVDALPEAPSFADVAACTPLRHAMLEAMRLHPAAPFFSRNVRTSAPLDFAGATWPAGTSIFVTPTALHRARAFWGDDADAYRPDRWDTKEAEAPIGSAFFWPFGRGPRECLGKHWALFYAQTALAFFLREATIELVPGEAREGFYFAVMVADGQRARFARR